ncbi:ABC transporter permease [uncultured Phascolarctobacterium sp.]|uniref:ABC transporter permease n=1 Tax=Phascolarctobacterium sp. TaxID=2049039 RepID=UPI0025D7D410|nr:ABC transporter permease [uncultured Phascolarctobacterium sp.]
MRILSAFIKKEFLQIIRDPSSILIAFILPTLLSLIYMYGINVDSVNIKLGLKLDDANPRVVTLARSFSNNPYIKTKVYDNNADMYAAIGNSQLQGAVIIPGDFSADLAKGRTAQVLVITDGSETNTANYVQSYASGIITQWLEAMNYGKQQVNLITPQLRVWYNEELDSHYFILPGSLAVTLSLVGILLTALVVAREWERGTMEALLSTRLSRLQFVLGKYFAYYVLGTLALWCNVFLCVTAFELPFRGSYIVLFFVGSLFLLTCMGIGLLISTIFKNQFLASQVSLVMGFLPALLLSGLMFPISSMPAFFRYLTAVLPQRYFVTFIESEFLAGTISSVVLINTVYLSCLCLVLLFLVYKNTLVRLEK